MIIDPIMKNLCEGAPGSVMPKSSGSADSVSFADQLKSKIEEVNKSQNDSDDEMQKKAVGGSSNIHESMIKLEGADMELRLLLKVRNKALDAYHEVMRMSF